MDTPSVLTTHKDTGSGTSTIFPSVNPAAGKTFILPVCCLGVTPTNLSASGCGLTWTRKATIARSTNWSAGALFIGTGTPSPGQVTVSTAGETGSNWLGAILEVAGMNLTTPLVAENIVTGSNTSASSLSVNYAQARGAGNAFLSFAFQRSAGYAPTHRTDWSELAEVLNSSTNTMDVQYYAADDTACSVSFGGTTTICIIGVELATAPTSEGDAVFLSEGHFVVSPDVVVESEIAFYGEMHFGCVGSTNLPVPSAPVLKRHRHFGPRRVF